MSVKQEIWFEIDKFLRKNQQQIKAEIEILKNQNLENKSIDYLLFSHLKKRVLTYLKRKRFTSLTEKFIERSIIAIYLLRSENPPLQSKIRKVAGFTANNQVKEIRQYLDIPLPLKEYEKLFDDSLNQMKQCRRCGRLLDYNKFTMRKEGNLRFKCNECRKTENVLNIWRKKIVVAKFITLKVKEGIDIPEFLDVINQNKYFSIEIKCFNCNIGLSHLPALQFHHTDKKLKIKGADWNTLRFKPLETIIRSLDQQNCIVLCANCHAMRTATFFNLYKDAIFSEETKEFSWQIRGKINRWIRKKRIIEDLFNGKCMKCETVNIDKLPALQIHHSDPFKKKHNFSLELRDIADIKKIKDILLEEDCTCLCSNCHSIEGATIFKENKNGIIQKDMKMSL